MKCKEWILPVAAACITYSQLNTEIPAALSRNSVLDDLLFLNEILNPGLLIMQLFSRQSNKECSVFAPSTPLFQFDPLL